MYEYVADSIMLYSADTLSLLDICSLVAKTFP